MAAVLLQQETNRLDPISSAASDQHHVNILDVSLLRPASPRPNVLFYIHITLQLFPLGSGTSGRRTARGTIITAQDFYIELITELLF